MKKLNIYLLLVTNLKKFERIISSFFLLLILVNFFGCLTAGTHGSIKAYVFPVPKNVLQKTINDVIEKELNLQVAPITDTFNSKYYNDGERYITINIKVNGGHNEYIFQYIGDKENWDTSKNSEISIAYAFDKDNKGGSEGDGKLSFYKFELRKKLIDVFENEFIDKIDTMLKQK